MNFRYGISDWPSRQETVLFALQWLLVMAPMVIIMGRIGAALQYPDSQALQQLYLQKLFLLSGAGMLAQLVIGHGLPIITGPAAVLLIGMAAGSPGSLEAVHVATAAGGLVLTLLVWSGALRFVSRLFTPRVTGVVLLLIAFTFLPTVSKLLTTGTPQVFGQLLFAGALLAAMLAGQRMLPRLLSSTVIIWALIIGSVSWRMLFREPLHLTKAEPLTGAQLLPSFTLIIDPAVLIAFLFCYLALLINELGSVQTTAKLLNVDAAKPSGRGVALTGISNVLAGLLGVIGPVSYSLSPGILVATRCASRVPPIVAAIALGATSFLPDVILIIAAIPPPVIGTLLFYVLCSQISASFSLLSPAMAVYTFDTGLIIGLPVMLGVVVAFLPEEAVTAMPSLLRPVLANGFVVGTATALLLEFGLLRSK